MYVADGDVRFEIGFCLVICLLLRFVFARRFVVVITVIGIKVGVDRCSARASFPSFCSHLLVDRPLCIYTSICISDIGVDTMASL